MQLLRVREEGQLTGSMHGAAVAAFARPRSAPLGDCSNKKRRWAPPPLSSTPRGNHVAIPFRGCEGSPN